MTDSIERLMARLRSGGVGHPAIEEVLPPEEYRTWSIWRRVARLLGNLALLSGCRSVLEFGSGRSSVVLARAVALNGGGALTSIENMPAYSEREWLEVRAEERVDSELVHSGLNLKLRGEGLRYEYGDAMSRVACRAPYDFVFIDGPPFFYGRDGTLPPVVPHLAERALVVMDDARRPAEQRTIRRWLRTRPGLELLALDPDFGADRGHGVAVLRYTGDPRHAPSAAAFLGCCLEQLATWRHARWKVRSLVGRTS